MGRPVILFGAFDRHNFGDLLLAQVARALLPASTECVAAGLAARDLRPLGGEATRALAALRAGWGERPAALLQVGGEVLDCTAWQAAAMLLPPGQAGPTIGYFETHPQQRDAWVQAHLGLADAAPYLARRSHWPALSRMVCLGLGGVGLGRRDPVLRAEVLAKLREADWVGVRDRRTQATLEAAGQACTLMPDAAVTVAALCAPALAQAARSGEPAELCAALPQGYLAVQLSAEFADDASLDVLAAGLDRASAEAGLGLVLFRAGSAPWHDDPGPLQRLAQRLRRVPVRLARSLQLWDICALIAGSRGYCGASLHGRIVATACALPRLSLGRPGSEAADKVAAYLECWEMPGQPGVVPADEPEALAAALGSALAVPADSRAAWAGQLVQAFMAAWAPAHAVLMRDDAAP